MKEIKRFHEGGYGTSEMKLSDYGDWVLYDDHAEIVAALQEQLSNYSMSAGQADQRKSESDAVRVELGFTADADDVAPCDLVDAITALQEQVLALAEFKHKVRQSFLIGDAAEDFSIFINIENTLRRSGCLSAVEREFFTREEPDEEYPDEMFEQCDLSWGAEPKEYIEDFRKALREIRGQAVEEFAKHLRGHMQDGSPLGLLAMGADEFAARIRSGEQP
ncbi:MAG: hypothetical protein [Bacteriophage sp.]|nr:MAG: hypothetical protein [Bacteriophage sp.]